MVIAGQSELHMHCTQFPLSLKLLNFKNKLVNKVAKPKIKSTYKYNKDTKCELYIIHLLLHICVEQGWKIK